MTAPYLDRFRSWRSESRLGGYLVPALLLLLVFTYPLWYRWPGIDIVTLDTFGLELDIVVVMAVYVMLALGLNVVVGYAGLLDLGYVAFYALGAYALGWFGSGFFSGVDFHFGDVGSKAIPGIHITIWPRGIVKSTSATATRPPNSFRTRVASRMLSVETTLIGSRRRGSRCPPLP